MTARIEPSTHAKLSASSAERWMECPGSVKASEGLPNKSSFYAAEGTFAHHIGAACLEDTTKKPEDWLGLITDVEGHQIECTQEMVDAVQDYLDTVRGYMQPGDALMVEINMTPALQKLHPQFGGTSDCAVFRPSTKKLRVFDYKHGAGVMVDVTDNKQLKYYSVGALLTLGLPAETVEITIVQPRCGTGETTRSWEFPADMLVDYVADLLDAADLVNAENPPMKAGDHCRWCLAAVKCPILEKKQLALMAAEFDVVEFMDPAKLAEALKMIPLVEARISQIREHAYNEGMKGNPPPGYKIVEKQARRQWKDEKAAETYAEMMLGDAAYTEPKLKSPAQIEKLLKKADREGLDEFVEKKSSGYTLVDVSDKRAPAQLATLEDFDVIT